MGDRKVLRLDRGPRGASLIFAEAPALAPAPDHVTVRVSLAVLDPEPLGAASSTEFPEAAFLGTIESAPAGAAWRAGQRVVGVGVPGTIVTVAPGRIHALPDQGSLSSEAAALLPSVSAVAAALRDAAIARDERVLVSGRGLTARLVAQVLKALHGQTPGTLTPKEMGPETRRGRGGRGGPGEGGGDADVVIDTTADAARWQMAMGSARRMGRVLLLIPPGEQLRSFDFYQRVHRGSLSLVSRRVPSPGTAGAAGVYDEQALTLLTSGQVSTEGLVALRGNGSGAATAISLAALTEGQGVACWFERQ